MGERMDGWMDGWMNRRINGWMDEWMEGRMAGWIFGCDRWLCVAHHNFASSSCTGHITGFRGGPPTVNMHRTLIQGSMTSLYFKENNQLDKQKIN